MKATLSALLICLLPAFALSQAKSSIDLIAGFAYSYRNLTTDSDDAIVIGIMEDRDEEESGKINWRAGFNYNRRLTKNFFLKTGLRMASIGFKGEKVTGLRWPSEHDGNGGWTPDPNLPHEIQRINDYWFLEVPVAGRWEFGAQKFTPFIEAGVSPSLYLTTRTKEVTDIGSDVDFRNESDQGVHTFHLAGFLSFGANYTLSQNLQLFAQPVFRYHLTPLAEEMIETYLFNYGLEVGVRKGVN